MLLRSTRHTPRRGLVLLSVLVVVATLSLAAYQYSEWMVGEYRAVDSATRAAQARALADSGTNYVAALLTSGTDAVGGNPFDNADVFANVEVPSSSTNGPQGRFSIITLRDPDDLANSGGQPYRYGVTDEASKINLNTLLQLDNGQGDAGAQVLLALPNMTQEIADAIIDWLDPDTTPRATGAEDEYYTSLDPAYHARNGPIDSLEELLLVKGVTPQLLFGNDRLRNGTADPSLGGDGGQPDMGWAPYLTVYSREPNVDSTGQPRIYINDPDLNTLQANLTPAVGDDLANFIIAYRTYGGSTASSSGSSGSGSGGSGSGGSGSTAKPATSTPAMAKPAGGGGTMSSSLSAAPTRLTGQDLDDVNKALMTARTAAPMPAGGGGSGGGSGGSGGGGSGGGRNQLKSVFDLVGATVNVPVTSNGTSRTVAYPSPLSDMSSLQQYLPLLLDKTTTSQQSELRPRINVNTASPTVLQAYASAIGLSDTDLQSLLAARPAPGSSTDPNYQTLAWLATEANLPASTVKKLEPYVTARSSVYRFQVLGSFDGNSKAASRVEAVVDTSSGRPRVVFSRNLTELGRGFPTNPSN